MAGPRLVLLAVDAADSRLVRRWAAAGLLPTFAELLGSGVVAPIETPVAMLEGGMWPTFLTSSSPATHGMFSFLRVKPGTYDVELGMPADRLPEPPFWAHMSRAGKRVAVIDAPFARPAEPLNGLQITNWGSHDSWSWPRSSFPAGLIDDVVARFGDHPAPHCDAPDRSPEDYERLRSQLIEGVERKTELLRHFLASEAWDFFFGVFSESHCAGHQLWHFMEPGHPQHRASTSPTLHSAIQDVYRAIDTGLGSLLKEVPPDVHVLVMLSHGMGPFYAGSHLLEAVLERLGLRGSASDTTRAPGRDSYAIRGLGGVVWNLRRLIPGPARRLLRSRVPRFTNTLWDWTHPYANLWTPGMRAFVLPSQNMTSGIRINVRGRELAGTVEPGAECEELCDSLRTALLELENPETGRPAVQWVARARDLYHGPRLNELPDLFVEWDHSAPINALRSARVGTVSGALLGGRTGDHVKEGLLLGRGPLFRRGEVGRIRTEDIAPTLLELLGVQRPDAYKGVSALRPFLARQPGTPAETL
jgi:predicted AlkP superfamily phosphohydrolase/phosphomutase